MEYKDTKSSSAVLRGYPKAVQWWLLLGVIMVFVQVIVGGITRLTGSGLSITRWEIITGTLPPLSAAGWEEAFDLYKATPQYQKINEGMSMGQFKFIYFWEYIHRLWGRLMGLVFIIPFFIFWRKGWIDRSLLKRLAWVIPLAALAASFGWIMVASGLVNRPWVNAYKLTIHLSLALILFGYLLWTYFWVTLNNEQVFHNSLLKKWTVAITLLASLQIVLGGIMSGTKAALIFPTWPDMNGAWVPAILRDTAAWNPANFVQYDANPFMPALVQFSHRLMAYFLIIIVLWFLTRAFRAHPPTLFRRGLFFLAIALLLQVVLGILTVINSVGTIPVDLGVFHQACALILLSSLLFLLYLQRSIALD